MTTLNISDAACIAGVTADIIKRQISEGKLSQTPDGIDVSELIRAYPDLKPLAGLKIREVKKPIAQSTITNGVNGYESQVIANTELLDVGEHYPNQLMPIDEATQDSGTVRLLVRELEWNKELLEQTNQLMAKQLADQRALIADQARRLDEKDRFWARQVEIAQSLLAAPTQRKKFLGIF